MLSGCYGLEEAEVLERRDLVLQQAEKEAQSLQVGANTTCNGLRSIAVWSADHSTHLQVLTYLRVLIFALSNALFLFA